MSQRAFARLQNLRTAQAALSRMDARARNANKADSPHGRRAADRRDFETVKAAVLPAIAARLESDAALKVEGEIRDAVRTAADPQHAEQAVAKILARLSVKRILKGGRS